MKIKVNLEGRKIKNFYKTWTNTLWSLGMLSGDPGRDFRVIGEIYETPDTTFLNCPDLPSEALEVLKEYFGKENIYVYED